MIFQNRDFYWYEDNAVVLASLTKGDSRLEDIDSATSTVHLALAHLGARGWFEYIQSDSNWADSASRLLFADPWAPRNGFILEAMEIPEWPWTGVQTDRVQSVVRALSL